MKQQVVKGLVRPTRKRIMGKFGRALVSALKDLGGESTGETLCQVAARNLRKGGRNTKPIHMDVCLESLIEEGVIRVTRQGTYRLPGCDVQRYGHAHGHNGRTFYSTDFTGCDADWRWISGQMASEAVKEKYAAGQTPAARKDG